MLQFDGQVAIVTGAGGGLGRAHALLLASRGAKVIVNDMGDGALSVAEEIKASGGEAVAASGSVTDQEFVEAMVAGASDRWGRVDILVNNAGILRDKSFAKMEIKDFCAVVDVHLMGAAICTKAVWEMMRQQSYGRIVMTTSSSGLFGNFGQSNYGAAKMALVGFMQTLGLEGEKYNIRVNCLAPTAATSMMEGILPERELQLLKPEFVSPGMLVLVAKDAPNRAILCAGAGGYEAAKIEMTRGIFLDERTNSPEALVAAWAELVEDAGAFTPENALQQSELELGKAGYRRP